jgi:hypothetical protein
LGEGKGGFISRTDVWKSGFLLGSLQQVSGCGGVHDEGAEDFELWVGQQRAQGFGAGATANAALAGHQDEVPVLLVRRFHQVLQLEDRYRPQLFARLQDRAVRGVRAVLNVAALLLRSRAALARRGLLQEHHQQVMRIVHVTHGGHHQVDALPFAKRFLDVGLIFDPVQGVLKNLIKP